MAKQKARKAKAQKPKKTLAERLRTRATSLLKVKGHLLQFVGGTATGETAVFGMDTLVLGEPQLAIKEELVLAIEHQIRKTPRRWTLTYGFIHKDEDGFRVEIDYFYMDGVDAITMDHTATHQMQKLWQEENPETRLGQIWVSTPYGLHDGGESFIENLDQWMEDNRYFDEKHMLARLTMNGLERIAAQEVKEIMESPEKLLEGIN